MIVLLTKLGSPEMVGQFALGLAVTAPIILFANLQLRSVQATDARQEFQFGHYFGLRLVTTGLALFSVIGNCMDFPIPLGNSASYSCDSLSQII
jgi:hypothetical protein